MNTNALHCPPRDKTACEGETDLLVQFIVDRFPEEAARADLSDRKSVVRLAIELLERLWRWER